MFVFAIPSLLSQVLFFNLRINIIEKEKIVHKNKINKKTATLASQCMIVEKEMDK